MIDSFQLLTRGDMAKTGPSIEFMQALKRTKGKPETFAERYAPARKRFPTLKTAKPGSSIKQRGPDSKSVKN